MPRPRHRRRPQPRRIPKKPVSEIILLDRFSVADIRKWAAYQDKIQRFHWDYYCNLAYQRSKVADPLRKALLDAASGPFPFSRWQRIVKYQYALDPLSVRGSLVDPGGRFNIGDVNPAQFPPFPALYLAGERHTALQEALSQKFEPQAERTALDFALAATTSIVGVSISGSLDAVIDLRDPGRLKQFVDLIKGFSIPEPLVKTAREVGLPPLELVQTVARLADALSDPNWRNWPMQCDAPSTSQIFGQLVAEAGIEGIVYPSKFDDKECLAVFPQNFGNSDSFVQLDDEPPPGARVRRLDSSNWQEIMPPKAGGGSP